MGTKRRREDQTQADASIANWRTLTLGTTALIDRIRRVYTGVILRRLEAARTSGLLPAIVIEIHSTTRPLPRPL